MVVCNLGSVSLSGSYVLFVFSESVLDLETDIEEKSKKKKKSR